MRNKTILFLISVSCAVLFSACKDTLDVSPDADGLYDTVELRFNLGCGSAGTPSAAGTRSASGTRSGGKPFPVSKVQINDSTIAEISVECTDLSSPAGGHSTRGVYDHPDTVPAPGVEIDEKCGTYYIVAYKGGKWHGVVKGRMENGKFMITKKLGFDSHRPDNFPRVSPGEYDFACINGAVAVDDSCKNICVRQPEAGVALIGMTRVNIDSKSGQHVVDMTLHRFGSRVAVDLLDYRYKSHFTGKIDVQGEIVTDHSLITELFTGPYILGPEPNGVSHRDPNGFLKYVKATLDGHPHDLSPKIDIHPLPLKVKGFNQLQNFGLSYDVQDEFIRKMEHGLWDYINGGYKPYPKINQDFALYRKYLCGEYSGRYFNLGAERGTDFVNDLFPVKGNSGSCFFQRFGNVWCAIPNFSTQESSLNNSALPYFDFYQYAASNDWQNAYNKMFSKSLPPVPERNIIKGGMDDFVYKMATNLLYIRVFNENGPSEEEDRFHWWTRQEDMFSLDNLCVLNTKLNNKGQNKVTEYNTPHSVDIWPYPIIWLRDDFAEFYQKSLTEQDIDFLEEPFKYKTYADFYKSHINTGIPVLSYDLIGTQKDGYCTPAYYQSAPFNYLFPGTQLDDLKFKFTLGSGLAGKTVNLMKATGEAERNIEADKFYHFVIKLKSASEKYPGLFVPAP